MSLNRNCTCTDALLRKHKLSLKQQQRPGAARFNSILHFTTRAAMPHRGSTNRVWCGRAIKKDQRKFKLRIAVMIRARCNLHEVLPKNNTAVLSPVNCMPKKKLAFVQLATDLCEFARGNPACSSGRSLCRKRHTSISCSPDLHGRPARYRLINNSFVHSRMILVSAPRDLCSPLSPGKSPSPKKYHPLIDVSPLCISHPPPLACYPQPILQHSGSNCLGLLWPNI